ncbi:MAG: hypothetical protein RLY49_104 [Candidatus Parcubacteria bacterium]|jgi:hypothetical protein
MTFFSLFNNAIGVVDQAIYILIGLAVVAFMWGIVKILFSRDNEIAKKEGREFMMYGVLTLFVMTSFWGLVNLLNGTISVQNTSKSSTQDPGAQPNDYSNIQGQLQNDQQQAGPTGNN